MTKKTKKVTKSFNIESSGPRICVIDIETSPIVLAEFGLYGEKSGNHKNILADWYIISAAWKMLGDKETQAVSVLDAPKAFKADPHDDEVVVRKLHEVLSSVDIICGHNISKFDWPKINTRFIKLGLPPIAKARHIDTYRVAKREFNFTSNRLDYIGEYLGLGGKMETPKGLWLQAIRGDAEAIKVMVEYNKQDVELTEKVYLALRPFDTAHVNMAVVDHDGACACPKCTSENLQKRGYSYTTTGKFQRYQCTDCGGWSRGRDNLLSARNNGGVKPNLTSSS